MRKTKIIISGITWSIIQNILSVLYGIISVPFLLNYFGKEEYGLIGIALSVNVYIQLLDMGMTDSNVRFFSEYIAKNDKKRVQKLLSLNCLLYLIIGFFNTIILFTISLFTEYLFEVTYTQSRILRDLLWILSLNAIFSWLSVCFGQFLQANDLVSWLRKRNTYLKLLQFLILFLTIYLRWDLITYFFCYIFTMSIILPWTISKVKSVGPYLHFRLGFDRETLHSVMPYAISVFSFSIFNFLTMNSRVMILGIMDGPTSVADYNIMYAITSVATMISGTFMTVLLPMVTKMVVKNDVEGINIIANKGTKYANVLISGLIFAIIVGIDEILKIYVGESYLYLAPMLIIWLLILLLSHRNVMTSLVFSEKRLAQVAIMGAFAMACAICLYVVLFPSIGILAIIIGYGIHEIIHTLFYYIYFLPKKFKINTWVVFKNNVFPTWCMFTVIALITYIINFSGLQSSSVLLIIKELFFIVITSISIWFFLICKEDKLKIVNYLTSHVFITNKKDRLCR